MSFTLEKLPPEEWKNFSSSAHKISFNQERDKDFDRIDYALMVWKEDLPCAYSTQIELDKDSVYMQHGGAFPNIENSVYSVKCYFMMVNNLKENYKTISTRIYNKNISMIKFAMAAGLLITGIEFIDGDIYLNLMWKKEWTTN